MLCILPPFEGWDEYQHVACLQHRLERGVHPTVGGTSVPAALIQQLPGFPQPRFALDQIQGSGARGYAEFWNPPEPPRGACTVALYQAQQEPLYYRLAAPVFALAGGLADLRTSVFTLRALNLLLLAAAVVLAGVPLLHTRTAATPPTLLAIATVPILLYSGLRVANDALALAFSMAALFLLDRVTGARPRCAALAAGLAAGAAICTKTTALPVVPAALTLTGLAYWRGALSPRTATHVAGAFVLGCLVVAGPGLAANVRAFGALTPMQEGLDNARAGHGTGDLVRHALALDWIEVLRRNWTRDPLWVGGWSYLRPPSWLRTAHEALLLLGLVAVLATGRRPPGSTAGLRAMATAGWATLAIGYVSLHSSLLHGDASLTPWYLAFAWPAVLTAVIQGFYSLPWRRVGPVLTAALITVFVAAETHGVLHRMPRAYAGAELWNGAASRLASLRPPWLGTNTLLITLALWLLLWGLTLRELWRYAEPARSRAS